MPKAYSVDLRKKVLETYLKKEGSIVVIAARFKISESTVKRIARQHRELGEIKLFLHNAGRYELIDETGKETLKKFISESPDMTLSEMQEKYFTVYGIKPVLAVFHRVLKQLKLNYKKKSHFSEQTLREDIKKKEKNLLSSLKTKT